LVEPGLTLAMMEEEESLQLIGMAMRGL